MVLLQFTNRKPKSGQLALVKTPDSQINSPGTSVHL